MIYTRTSTRTLFLLPAIAIGVEEDGKPFLEVAWLWWAVGVGDKE
jgi:hypothetical protein